MLFIRCKTPLVLLLLAFSFGMTGPLTGFGQKLQVCASTPDLADIALQVGGEDVEVFSFARGPQDPHDLVLRPQLIRRAADADLLLLVGRGIEHAWIDTLLDRSGNSKIQEGGPGHLDLGLNAAVIGEQTGIDGESSGPGQSAAAVDGVRDVHLEGNPHYLLDPIEGLRAAREIAVRLGEIKPEKSTAFMNRFEQFMKQLIGLIAGEEAAAACNPASLSELRSGEDYDNWYQQEIVNSLSGGISGLTGRLEAASRRPVVGDHDLWAYFSRRFSLEVAGYIEEHPGIPAAPGHMQKLIRTMKDQGVGIILKSTWFSSRPVRMVSRASGAEVVEMAHQTQAVEAAGNYLQLMEYNITQLVSAFTER